jgi:hypothetical protein
VTRTLKCWYSFEISLVRMPRVLTCPKAIRSSRVGEAVEVRRSPQAAACRTRCVGEPGRPQRLLPEGSMHVRYTVIEAQKGKPGHGVRPEPKRECGSPEQEGGGVLSKGKLAACRWGVLSGVVL